MRVCRIMLIDNCDNKPTDLVLFENDYELTEIEKVINTFKDKDYEKNGFYTYSVDDIIYELRKNFDIKNIMDLSSIIGLEY